MMYGAGLETISKRAYHVQQSRLHQFHKAIHVTLSLYVNQCVNSNVRFRKNPEKYIKPELDDKFLKVITGDFRELAKRLGMQAKVYMRSLGDVQAEYAQTGEDVLIAYACDDFGNELHLGFAL